MDIKISRSIYKLQGNERTKGPTRLQLILRAKDYVISIEFNKTIFSLKTPLANHSNDWFWRELSQIQGSWSQIQETQPRSGIPPYWWRTHIKWNRGSEGPEVAHTGKCLYQDTWITCFLKERMYMCKLRYPMPFRGGPKSNPRMKLRKPKQDLSTRVCPKR